MKLAVERLDLLIDGILPCDSIMGDRYRQVFCSAKPLIDYAFKVDRAAFVRVWWFDRYLPSVFDFAQTARRPERGKFYPVSCLLSESDRNVADYLMELGWQVRLTLHSLNRLEYVVLTVFDGAGAVLEEDERYRLRILEAEQFPPEGPEEWLPIGLPDRDRRRELIGV